MYTQTEFLNLIWIITFNIAWIKIPKRYFYWIASGLSPPANGNYWSAVALTNLKVTITDPWCRLHIFSFVYKSGCVNYWSAKKVIEILKIDPKRYNDQTNKEKNSLIHLGKSSIKKKFRIYGNRKSCWLSTLSVTSKSHKTLHITLSCLEKSPHLSVCNISVWVGGGH